MSEKAFQYVLTAIYIDSTSYKNVFLIELKYMIDFLQVFKSHIVSFCVFIYITKVKSAKIKVFC